MDAKMKRIEILMKLYYILSIKECWWWGREGPPGGFPNFSYGVFTFLADIFLNFI